MKVLKFFTISLLSIFFVNNGYAQTKPASADEVIQAAKAEAVKTDKNIFVIFHASWCIWCHRMDTAMNDESIKSFFDKNSIDGRL